MNSNDTNGDRSRGGQLVTLHSLSIAVSLGSDEVTLDRDNVGLLVERARTFCDQRVDDNEGLVLDFEGVIGIFADAAEDFARFVRNFRNGSLGLDGDNRNGAAYLTFRNLFVPSTRQGVNTALREMSANRPDKLTVVAPMAHTASNADAHLRNCVVGSYQSVRQASTTFFAIWNADTWLSPADITEQMSARRDRRQVYSDLNRLAGHGLVARKPGSGNAFLYAPIR